MSRKVDVEIKVRVVMTVDENVSIEKIINEMEYEFSDTTTQATIEDTEILDFEVVDSK